MSSIPGLFPLVRAFVSQSTMLSKLKNQLSHQGEALAYMDDITFLLKTTTSVDPIWDVLNAEAAKVGLRLSAEKCLLMGSEHNLQSFTVNNHDSHTLQTLPSSLDGVVVLGVLVGDQDFCLRHWKKRLDVIRRESQIICGWSRKQEAFSLPRPFIITQFNFILRCLSPSPWAHLLLDKCTEIIHSEFAKLLMMNQDDVQDRRCGLHATLHAFSTLLRFTH